MQLVKCAGAIYIQNLCPYNKAEQTHTGKKFMWRQKEISQ